MIEVAIALSLVIVAVAVSLRMRLRLESDIAVAVVRALVQLGAVAVAIQIVFASVLWSAGLIVVMLAAAAWTAGRRLAGIPHATPLTAAVIGSSAAVALIVLFGTGVFAFEPRFLIPIAGMVIGNAMTAASVAGSRMRDEIRDKLPEIEARLALGVPVVDALRSYTRRSATTSLIPIIDSTKNVGIIFLPGAFVGMLLGGADPYDAARVQLIVLFMLLGAVSVAAMTTSLLTARAFMRPGERIEIPSMLRS